MAKRLSEKDINNIAQYFINGKNIEELAKKFQCTRETIIRNLKKNLGNEKYKELIDSTKNKYRNKSLETKNELTFAKNETIYSSQSLEESFLEMSKFTEIAPLDLEIDDATQKDLSSVSLSEADFPKIVYMVVDKNVELETKYLKEYPKWQFLSNEDLNRKTIEIFLDLKSAKRSCLKEQKVIKVPNTDVFRIVTPILMNKGISRIVSADKLIFL